MADKRRAWANRQIIWGWIFLISMTVLLLYLLFAIWLPRIGAGDAAAVDELTPAAPTVDVDHGGMPAVKVTAIAQAQATLDSAAEQPIQAASAVREAAQTVMAVTAESFEIPAVVVTTTPIVSESTPAAETGDETGAEDQPTGLGWVDWILSAIPGLTAILSFVGLVFSSIMKWRDELQDMGHDDVGFERQRLEFEMQKQRFEMEREHQKSLLEQQRMELQLERERLEFARLQQKTGQGSSSDSPDLPDDMPAPAV